MTHGTGPGTFHALGLNGALVDNFQCRYQFPGEVGPPPLVTGQSGQGAGHGHLAEVAAVVGFQPPESNQVRRRYAGFLGYPIEQVTVGLKHLPAFFNAGVVDPPAEVIGKGSGELGLAPVQLNNPGQKFHVCQYAVGDFRGYPF